MNRAFIKRISLLFLPAILNGLVLLAQPPSNKPGSAIQPPAPTLTVNPVPSGYIISGVHPVINYVRTREATGRITDETVFAAAAFTDVMESTQYSDGLGRPVQTVHRQASPGSSPYDIVEPVYYNQLGQEKYKYLPYVQTTGTSTSDGKFKLAPFSDQANFYQNVYPAEQPAYTGEQVYYGQINYELSPLERITQELFPGNSWTGSGKGISHQFLFNISTDAVRSWTITSNSLTYDVNGNADVNVNTNIPATSVVYDPGQLNKNVTIDEHGNAVVEYSDKDGKQIMKKVQSGAISTDYSGYTNWLCTYYVYDDFGRLRFVIPPKAVAALVAASSWNLAANTTLINELCFRYEYDNQGRIMAKKTPGAGWAYMVYDQRDRQVFTQDANMRAKHQWMTMLYDGLNRVVMTGVMTGTINQDALQATVTTITTTPSNPGGLAADPVLNMSTTGINQGLHSITMVPGFSANGVTGNFVAQIVGADGETTAVNGVTVNKDPIPLGYSFIPLTMIYYDDYSWTSKAFTSAYNGSVEAGSNSHAEVLPGQSSIHTRGMATGSKIRTLENPDDLTQGSLLETANYFNDRGALIQVQADNYKGGLDITTRMYDFTGKTLSTYLVHNNPAAGTSGTIHAKTNINYDVAGRELQESQTVNDDAATNRLIAQMSYDQMGKLKQKQLGQKQDLSFLETQAYTYNIRGWLKGINKDYVNNDNSHGGNNRWFGLELSYDWGFAGNQYNGNISGAKWRSSGDGQQRAYGFGYDPSNRLLYGDFSQYDGSAYTDNGTVNFDMLMGTNGTDVASAYDENGNIQAMKQWGLKVNASGPIDALTYNYISGGNRLKNVIDAQNDAQTKLGDFRTSSLSPNYTGKTSGSIDYNYDGNGNLTRDLNKDIGTASADGIVYNHLNLPYRVTFQSSGGSKGTITYIYDAAGKKLKKTTVDNAAGTQTITTYIGDMVYQSTQPAAGGSSPDLLQFISNPEGRIRPTQTTNGAQTTTTYNYDYFIRDHLGSVRAILTDEQLVDIYPAATLENNGTPATDPLTIESNYYSINATQIVGKPTGITNYQNNNGNPPADNNPNCSNTSVIKQTDLSQKMYLMNAASNAKTGLGITLKVMKGDKLDIFGMSFYSAINSGGQSANASMAAIDIITGLLGAPGSPALGHATSGQISSNTAGTMTPLGSFITNHDNPLAESTPRAYINYVFFDQQFNFAGSGISQVGSVNTVTDHYRINQTLNNIAVPKNGYVYVFCSNESPVNVYFDNLQVILTHGPLLEETHYYPFGLTMAGISDKALKMNYAQNKYLYNGKELQNQEFGDGSGLEMYDYGKRFFDPQIGRFFNLDPAIENYMSLSPYVYGANNPLRFIDIQGMGPGDRIKKAESMKGKKYSQGTDNQGPAMRVAETKEALDVLDCSELVSRVLADDGITNGVRSMTTLQLVDFLADEDKFICTQSDPQPGDIFIWRDGKEGHTGIIKSYDKKDGTVETLEARGVDYLSGEFTRKFASFALIKGFRGFYRPKNENPDKNQSKSSDKASDKSTDDKQKKETREEKFKRVMAESAKVLQLYRDLNKKNEEKKAEEILREQREQRGSILTSDELD